MPGCVERVSSEDTPQIPVVQQLPVLGSCDRGNEGSCDRGSKTLSDAFTTPGATTGVVATTTLTPGFGPSQFEPGIHVLAGQDSRAPAHLWILQGYKVCSPLYGARKSKDVLGTQTCLEILQLLPSWEWDKRLRSGSFSLKFYTSVELLK